MERKKLYWIIAGVAAGLLSLTFVLLWVFLPSGENAFPYENTDYQAVINGQVRTDVAVLDGQRYYSYALVKESFDPYLWWEEGGSTLTVTNAEGLHRFSLEETNLDLQMLEGEPYLSEALLQALYGVTPTYVEQNRVSVWLDSGYRLGTVTSLKNTLYLRKSPSMKAPRVQILQECRGIEVGYALEPAEDGWLKIMSTTGEIGYVQESQVKLTENPDGTGTLQGVNQAVPGTVNGLPAFVTAHEKEKISMVWEAVYSANPNTAAIGPMVGLDVIAPTWFTLVDAAGTMSSMASSEYVTWAHGQGYAVWGTVASDVTDPAVTSAMLHNEETRLAFVQQLVDYAVEYELDGINVDFENMEEADKWLFTQFVRELSALCHEKGLVVSCDVTPISTSGYWSLCYDRASLAASVDYLCVMCYDQHTAGSSQAGSVSQLSWTRNSLERILQEVPAEKILLGIPFYTRLWEESEDADGTVHRSSTVLWMEDTLALIAEKELHPAWDEQSGQFFASYEEEGSTFKLWIEDDTSVAARVALVQQYHLAGCAAWRRGFETEDIWEVIAHGLDA